MALSPQSTIDPPKPTSSACARCFGTAGLILALAHGGGLLGVGADYTFVVVGLAALGACVAGLRRFRPRVRWPWIAVTSSVVLFLAGGALRVTVHSFGDLSSGRSLLPDFVVLPGYGLIAAGLIGIVRARNANRGRDLDALLDSAVMGLAALTLAWAYLMTPALFAADLPMKVRLSLVVYPPLSVFMATLGARIAFSAGRRSTVAQRLFLIMTVAMVAGDLLSTLGDGHIAAIPKTVADLPYVLAFVALGSACLHPSMKTLSEPWPSCEEAPIRARLVLTAFALVLPAFVGLARTSADRSEISVLVTLIVLLTAGAVARVLRALRAQARAQAHLRYEATHDALTGLANRSALLEQLSRQLESATERSSITVIFLDVDRFKLVNDSGGHSLGDELLVEIARRLRSGLTQGGVVARIGGDEFVVAIEGLADATVALAAAEAIRASFQQPFRLRGSDIFSSASLGTIFVPAEGEPCSAEGLIRDADTAMYRAKASGRDGVAVFDSRMRDEVSERLSLEQDLRRAVELQELRVHFQPIVRLSDSGVEGFEALVRWHHHSRGLIPPDQFIPIAEESDLILEIGAWVLQESLRHLAVWRSTLPQATGLYVAVNFSTRQLRHATVTDQISAALEAAGLPASSLCVEITESLLMEDPDTMAGTLGAIRKLGVKLSIDDFGTGYSSLSYLSRFPVDHVKIDRSFVEGLDTPDGVGANLVAAIIAMSQALGMRAIAEGVETALQGRRLREMGTDRAQGYYFSRPVPPEAIPEVLERMSIGEPRPSHPALSV